MSPSRPEPERAPRRAADPDAEELKRAAERICALILNDEYPRIDIEIARANLKRHVRQRMPDKLALYEMVYESRFRRLWNQWRQEDPML